MRRRYTIPLTIFTGLFVLRVLGQTLVAFLDVGFLPAMEHWYSGLILYPILLPIQIVMIIVMVKLIKDVRQGAGLFSGASYGMGVFLKWFSIVYFLSMVLRYFITMVQYPELRWFGRTIPIWFHMVLAAFVFTYSRYQRAFGVKERSQAA